MYTTISYDCASKYCQVIQINLLPDSNKLIFSIKSGNHSLRIQVHHCNALRIYSLAVATLFIGHSYFIYWPVTLNTFFIWLFILQLVQIVSCGMGTQLNQWEYYYHPWWNGKCLIFVVLTCEHLSKCLFK